MKKIASIALLTVFLSLTAEAGSINGKLGTGYAADPQKYGLNCELSFYKELDPYFHLGFVPAFFWVKWRDRLENITTDSGVSGSRIKDTDAYMFPVLATAKVRIVDLKEKFKGILPYVTVGLGYSAMMLTYENAEGKSKADFFGGFTWQVMVGGTYSPSANSKIEFIAEAGYRSAPVQNHDDIEIDMSGFIANIGVSYPF